MKSRFAKRNLLLEAFLATILVFVVMGLIALIPYNIKALNPIKEIVKDFRYTDIYYSKISSDRTSIDTSIVLVNIGSADRYKISQVLSAIEKQNPAVVGIDALFPQREDTANIALAAAFSKQRDYLVAGLYLEQNEDKVNKVVSDPIFEISNAGYLNLVGEDSLNTTIRYFRPYISGNGEEYLSWSAQIVKLYDIESYNNLEKRGDKAEIINYTGDYNSFIHLEIDDLINSPAEEMLLQNKIVLLGYMGEYTGEKRSMEDLHFTPLNEEHLGRSKPDMYGLVIQANIISMILHGDYIDEMPGWLELVISFFICYVHVVFFILFFVKQHLWYHPVAKIAQFLTSAILLYIMLLLYAEANYSINTTVLILGVILSVDVLYLYETFAVYLHKKSGMNSLFTQQH